MSEPGAFRFVAVHVDHERGQAAFEYAVCGGPRFVERIVFDGERRPLDATERAALERCLGLAFLVAGVSYYKAFAPTEILVEEVAVTPAVARFCEQVYEQGLAEFAHRNQIDLRGQIHFPSNVPGPTGAARVALSRRTAVPIGGGKDSCVTLERLRAAGEPLLAVSVRRPTPVARVIEAAGVSSATISRTIAPELLEWNRRGAPNGHVPITAILSTLLAAASLVYGYDAIAMSNERSADVGNLEADGREVNHQWSKSRAFERAFADLIRDELLPPLRYFSFLRPLSELGIARLFATMDRYHPVFASCNRGFRLDAGPDAPRWCGACPKCRFVFLVLAPFFERKRLLEVFGANLLADPSPAARAAFDALVGRDAHKPFECVGEYEESLAALVLLARSPEWREDTVVARFARDVLPALPDPDGLVADALAPSDDHRVPDELRPLLDDAR